MMAVKATSLDDLSHGVSATREEGGHLKNKTLQSWEKRSTIFGGDEGPGVKT